uniref:Uncharacterized protein n=1 Tax=Anopheles arabiensis TaxID=7173 RepID=A0A182IH69_ANOAR
MKLVLLLFSVVLWANGSYSQPIMSDSSSKLPNPENPVFLIKLGKLRKDIFPPRVCPPGHMPDLNGKCRLVGIF